MREDTRRWIESDHAHCWHPFTRQAEWCGRGHEPLVLVRGEGSWLVGFRGAAVSGWKFLDLDKHPRPRPSGDQRGDPGTARKEPPTRHFSASPTRLPRSWPPACADFSRRTRLERVFFSDDGSTAVECALKMAVQYRQQTGAPGAERLHRLRQRLPRRHARRGLAWRGRTVFRAFPGRGLSRPSRQLDE